MSFLKKILPIFLVAVVAMAIFILGASIVVRKDHEPVAEKNIQTIYYTQSSPGGGIQK